MSVGDLSNNREKLRNELKAIRYSEPINLKGLTEGHPSTSLPIIHFCLLGYSRLVSEYFTEQGFDLYMKNDYSFMETVFKILRQMFNYRPVLTIGQFLAIGYAERKILMCLDVIGLIKEKHLELLRFKQLDERKTAKSPIRTPKKVEEEVKTQNSSRPLPKAPSQIYKQPEEMLNDFGNILKDSSKQTMQSVFRYDTPERKQTYPAEESNIFYKGKAGSSSAAHIQDQCLEYTTKQYNDADSNMGMKQLFMIMKELENKVVKLESRLSSCMEQTDAKLNLINGKIKMLEQDQNQQNIPEKVNNIERPVLAEKPPIQKKAEVSIKKPQEGLLAKLGISNSILGYTNSKGEEESSIDTFYEY
ncbi:unnamed protein product [Blepharisma stoltei]|uniref:Centrosomal protein of 44 kDa n=1 Tax=Blepharisma stoltei TaxID=1481888 RepID=A0AAU9ILH1_9CILI|nr:unnamed protein product [Blepharisma stoltei]